MHAWISHHVEQNHGPPSFFITLSCAEYHWKDIERLIANHCEKGLLDIPDMKQRQAAIVNEFTIVVQEYFHARVHAWLETVGKQLLGIKYHWLHFEFAPSRGQIHVHMLAICDNIYMLQSAMSLGMTKTSLWNTYLVGWKKL